MNFRQQFYLDANKLSDDVSKQPDPHTRHAKILAEDGYIQSRRGLKQFDMFDDICPHEDECGKRQSVDEEQRFVWMFAKLGVHLLLIDSE